MSMHDYLSGIHKIVKINKAIATVQGRDSRKLAKLNYTLNTTTLNTKIIVSKMQVNPRDKNAMYKNIENLSNAGKLRIKKMRSR